MSTQPNQPTPSAPPEGASPFEAWATSLPQIAYGLLAVGAALIILTLVMGYRDDWNTKTLVFWGLSVGLVLLVAGIFAVVPDSLPGFAPADFLRLLVLVVLGGCGLFTAVSGLLLMFVQYRDELGGDIQEWRKHSDKLSLCIGAFLGGLVLMFAGLSIGRSYERTRPSLRRLLYGYNAIFSSLLLLLTIIILNILLYSPVKPFSSLNAKPIDWTAGHLYSLKPESKDLLARIKEPVKVYIILPSKADLTQQMLTLVRDCSANNPLLSWDTLSPQISDEKIKSLRKQYNLPEDSLGVLVVYGSEPSGTFRFLTPNDLQKPYTNELGQQFANEDGSPKLYFTGEVALMRTLQQLAFQNNPIKVYFTQGNGELDFAKVNRNNPFASMATLKTRFDPKIFDMAALPFDKEGAAKGIPEDANIVVIAGPREQLTPQALQALHDYLDKRKGKLFVMLGVMPNPEGEGMQHTGLEVLLREYGVNVGDNQVLYTRFTEMLEMQGEPDDPLSLRVRTNPDSNNPIAKKYADEQREFRFDGARTVEKLAEPTSGPGRSVDEIVETITARDAFADTTLTPSPTRLAMEVARNKDMRARLVAKKPLPLAVAVTSDQKPQLIVVGCSVWISDLVMRVTKLGNNNFDLLGTCLAWLADRPDAIFPFDDKPPAYTLNIPEERVWPAVWLPGLLMMMAVVTLGGGVWIVRRR